MINIVNNIFEDDFNKKLTHTYNLSILVGVDRLSYFIADQQHQALALRTYLYDSPKNQNKSRKNIIRGLLLEDSILRERFQAVKIGLATQKMTLVPDALFDDKALKTYLEPVVPIEADLQFLADKIPSVQTHNVYAFEGELISVLLSYFSKARFFHSSTGLISNFLKNANANDKGIFLNLGEQELSLTVLDRSKLLYHNQFSIKASEDCLYYVLLVFKLLGMNPKKHLLHLAGELVEDSEIYKLLYKYVRNIHFVNRPAFYAFNENIREELSEHRFVDLFSLQLCE